MVHLMFLEGHYVYTEASTAFPGAAARMFSSDLRYETGQPRHMQAPFCLQFWYHMHGSDVGSLRVFQYDDVSNPLNRFEIWGANGDQDDGNTLSYTIV